MTDFMGQQDITGKPELNLIEQQRFPNADRNLEYPNSPSPEKHLASLGLTIDDLPGELSDEKIMTITESQANGFKMLRLAETGQFEKLIPKIRDCLHAAGATAEEFSRLESFKLHADPKNPSSISAAMLLARDAWKLKNKVDTEFSGTPPGQLNYKLVEGLYLQPK